MDCLVIGCGRKRKRVKSYSTGNKNSWCWSYGKYCSMHYERIRKFGEPGTASAHTNRGQAWLGTSGYMKCVVFGKERYVHRMVWESYYGKIPKGYHIHHKDGNKLNNDIVNLELLTESEHHKFHAKT